MIIGIVRHFKVDCKLKKIMSSDDFEKYNLNSDENVLIVSHGFFLITLINELKLLGFKGNIPKKMKNGYLYILKNY
ncbi:hypothetical protein [Clostridium oryzae]|uniref:2,3-bisphosphoglycerate-dependent phosphoglycerate mutase n=1 Tax=Clostridium oryzae TaxID=1450648 RepID=A0A1V4IWH9_9CLOT|nr:hypothetical protein [Clostridium oryzae]OPJ64401.1 hypothetical protein CLORY_05950 [Clostridium oryzae]